MIDGARWVAVVAALAMVATPTAATLNGQRTHDTDEPCRDRVTAKIEEMARRTPRTFADLRERLADRCDDDDPSDRYADCRDAIRQWHRDAEALMQEHRREWQAFRNETRQQMHRLVEDDNVTWREVRAFHRDRAERAQDLMQEHRREMQELAGEHPARDECRPPQDGSSGHHRTEPHPCTRRRSDDATTLCHDRARQLARCFFGRCG